MPNIVLVRGKEIRRDGDNLDSLNDLWIAAGSPKNHEPWRWGETEQAKKLIDVLASKLNLAKNEIWKSRRGRHLGGTWVHEDLAIAYAEYLSPEFHLDVIAAFKEWRDERSDPGLKMKRAVEGFRKKGMDDDTIRRRLDGIITRKDHTATLKDRGCAVVGKLNPYRESTVMLTSAAIGQTPKEFKESKGLPVKAKTRDHMTARELGRIQFAENEATCDIKESNAYGNDQCMAVIRQTRENVIAAVRHMDKKATA